MQHTSQLNDLVAHPPQLAIPLEEFIPDKIILDTRLCPPI